MISDARGWTVDLATCSSETSDCRSLADRARPPLLHDAPPSEVAAARSVVRAPPVSEAGRQQGDNEEECAGASIKHACQPLQLSRALFVALADGAGGKGTWGKEGEMYDPDAPDPKDPNYESGDEGIVMEATEEVKK